MKSIIKLGIAGVVICSLSSFINWQTPLLKGRYLLTNFTSQTFLKDPVFIVNDSVKKQEKCDCPEKEPNGNPDAYQKSLKTASLAIENKDPDLPIYLNPNIPIEKRIDDLIPRLTLEEKVIQLSDSWGSKGIARLKVPPMLKTEGLHGQSYATGSTIFPHAINMASTFNTDLIKEVGKATAVESKAAGLRSSWSPVLDVARDTRWGRIEETYGEDPFLVGRMGVAWIKGFQGEDMIAVPKHFAGHGEPLGGRDSHDVGLSDRVMRNIHLPPFREAITEAHAGGVMAAYSTWNAVPDNASDELLQKILREEWGFDGFVVSDCGGPENLLQKQSVVRNFEEAARNSVLAGVDIECGSAYKKYLALAVKNGYLKESDLDANLRRVFRAKMKLGLFEKPGTEKMIWTKLPEYDTPEHRTLAREVALQSSILLKNENKLLPLSKNIPTIAVIGPNADLAQTGDYSAKAAPGQLITVLQGIKSHVSSSTKVLYAKGCDILSNDTSGFEAAVNTAKQADVVVLVVGDNSSTYGKATTGENIDGATLEFPGAQRQLIKEIRATGKPVVLVLVNGKPMTLNWEAENIPAILETWFPGEEGGNATADLIFGDKNPSGKLPITFPRHVGQVPLTYNYLPTGRNYPYYDMPFTPLYRFGYGLSYTKFSYSNIKTEISKEGTVSVTADVENIGDRAGDEVAQLYVTDVLSSVITPIIELKGVHRVSLKPKEKKRVSFDLTPYHISLLNKDMERVVEPGKFLVHVGGASPTPPDGNFEHKQKIGFKKAEDGVTGEFNITKTYQANFDFDVKIPAKTKGGEPFKAEITVTNRGNILDIADAKVYGDSLLSDHRWEIEAGETKKHTFNISIFKSGKQTIVIQLGKKIITKLINVTPAPAKVNYLNVRTDIDSSGVYTYAAKVKNSGSSIFKGDVPLSLNGKQVYTKTLELNPGQTKELQIAYDLPGAGNYRIKVGDAPEQQIVVQGGVRMALQNPLIYLDFEKKSPDGVINEINGSILSVNGKPEFVQSKNGTGFKTKDGGTFINAGKQDIYRKSFTLAAWVNIETLDKANAMFFGGQAPMGADVDNTGTALAAGINNNKILLSFQERDIVSSENLFSVGKWQHFAYSYNSDLEEGAIYLDGKLVKKATQKPYAGPLDIIAGAARFNHGNYTIDEVLVTKSCLPADVIKTLAAKGIDGLRKGQLTTDWKTANGPLTTLSYNAQIAEGSTIQLTLEISNEANNVITKSFDLKSGQQTILVDKINTGTKVRLRVEFETQKWTALPVLDKVVLSGGEPSAIIRWSTITEWVKGATLEGVKSGE